MALLPRSARFGSWSSVFSLKIARLADPSVLGTPLWSSLAWFCLLCSSPFRLSVGAILRLSGRWGVCPSWFLFWFCLSFYGAFTTERSGLLQHRLFCAIRPLSSVCGSKSTPGVLCLTDQVSLSHGGLDVFDDSRDFDEVIFLDFAALGAGRGRCPLPRSVWCPCRVGKVLAWPSSYLVAWPRWALMSPMWTAAFELLWRAASASSWKTAAVPIVPSTKAFADPASLSGLVPLSASSATTRSFVRLRLSQWSAA